MTIPFNTRVIIMPVSLTSSCVALPSFSSSPVRLSAWETSVRTTQADDNGKFRCCLKREADPRARVQPSARDATSISQKIKKRVGDVERPAKRGGEPISSQALVLSFAPPKRWRTNARRMTAGAADSKHICLEWQSFISCAQSRARSRSQLPAPYHSRLPHSPPTQPLPVPKY